MRYRSTVPAQAITSRPIVTLAVVAMGLATISVTGCTRERRPQPQNRTAILIDTSGTYKHRFMDSVEKAAGLLEQIANTKVRRWEIDADYVAIITIDALPDVIWQGNLHELQALDKETLRERLAARSDYAGCTDVTAAFAQAVARVDGDPRAVHKYLFVFSDLIDEPPTSSASKCKPPKRPSDPPDAMPWEALREMSVTAFWLPVSQKLAWSRAIAEAGLSDSFRLYSESESALAQAPAPPRPTRTVTDTDRQAARNSLMGAGTRIFKIVGFLVGGAVCISLLIAGLALLTRRRGGRNVSRGRVRGPRTMVRSTEMPPRNHRRTATRAHPIHGSSTPQSRG